MNRTPIAVLAFLMIACGPSSQQSDSGPNDDGGSDAPGADATPGGKVVFVVPMENQDFVKVIGNSTDAPYINQTLLPAYASASNFQDELAIALPSEPHYVWMESGTNAFSDHTFTNDNDSSSANSTSSTDHLSHQLEAAGVPWMAYQEDMAAGTCPISSSGYYAAKHDPFVFFQDVAGATPSATDAHCIAHHKPLSSLSADLQSSTVSGFNFITPNLCHDMHGASGCPGSTQSAIIKAGDDWLKANVPSMIDYALAHDGYVFIVWDEGSATQLIPFVAIGKHAVAGRAGTVQYTHSSLLKSEEEIFGVPILPTVASANDFADLFDPGTFP